MTFPDAVPGGLVILNPLPTNLPPDLAVITPTTSIFSLMTISEVVTIPVVFMVNFDSGIDAPAGNATPLVNSTGPVPASSNFVNS